MSFLTTVNDANPQTSYFLPADVAIATGATGPAGPTGAVGPLGPIGEQGLPAYGEWYYSAGLTPNPQEMTIGASTITFSYVGANGDMRPFLYACSAHLTAIGSLTVAMTQLNGTFGPVSVSNGVTNIAFFDPLGYAVFTVVGALPAPINWAVGFPVQVFAGGVGGAGPIGPTGPAGAAGAVGATGATGATGAMGATGSAADASLWWQYPAGGSVNMNNQNFTNVGTITGFQANFTNASITALSNLVNLYSGSAGITNLNVYQSDLTGFGNLQVGALNPLAPNPGAISLNGTFTQQRGYNNFYINALGIEMDNSNVLPGFGSVKFGAIPVSGVNTCRFEMNTVTSPGAFSLVAPAYVTADAVGDVTLAAGSAASLKGGVGGVTLEAAAAGVTVKGTGSNFADLLMPNGGSITGMGSIVGQATGVGIGNVNGISGLAGSNITIGNTLLGTSSNVNYRTPGDVVALFGTAAPASLSTVSGIVKFKDNTEFYVSDSNGHDDNPGSILQPFKTVQKAITTAEAGSSAANICVINIASGHYNENLTFTKGYVILQGAINTQTGNEISELTGSITITATGASDLFNRQVGFIGLNITCGAGQLVTNNSTTPTNVWWQDCKVFVNSQFYVHTAGAAADARTYFTNCDISSTAAANTSPVVNIGIGAVEIERCDFTTDGNANSLLISGTALLQRLSLSTLENTTTNGAAAPILQITSSNLGINSIGSTAFTYSSVVSKAASPSSCGIYIASGVNTVLLCFNNIFTLAGTSSSTNFVIGYNGVGGPSVTGYANIAAYLPPTINYANSIQTGITRATYWNIAPPNSAAYSSTANQTNTSPGTALLCTVNTTESPAGQGGIVLSANTFTVTNTGTFSITYTGNFANTGSDALVYLWANLNGTRIGRSAAQQTVANNHTETLTRTIIFNLTAGQNVSFSWLSAGANVSLTATAAGGAGLQPATPSFYVSIAQVA